jgi:hypothetical protein
MGIFLEFLNIFYIFLSILWRFFSNFLVFILYKFSNNFSSNFDILRGFLDFTHFFTNCNLKNTPLTIATKTATRWHRVSLLGGGRGGIWLYFLVAAVKKCTQQVKNAQKGGVKYVLFRFG